MTDNGKLLSLYDKDGTRIAIAPSEQADIMRALEQLALSNGTRDTVLELEAITGATIVVLASRIASLYITTREQRARDVVLNKRAEEETAELREEAGYPPAFLQSREDDD